MTIKTTIPTDIRDLAERIAAHEASVRSYEQHVGREKRGQWRTDVIIGHQQRAHEHRVAALHLRDEWHVLATPERMRAIGLDAEVENGCCTLTAVWGLIDAERQAVAS